MACWLAALGQSQTVPGGADRPVAAALANALVSLKSQVNDQNYAKMGFRSRAEANSAMFGEPIRRYIVRPDKLLAFQAGADPATVLEDTRQWIYPVLANGDVRCAVTMAWRGPGFWKAIAFGDQGLSRILAEVRHEQSNNLHSPGELFFLLDVVSVNRKFIALRTDGNAPDKRPGSQNLVLAWLGPPPDNFPKRESAERVLLYLATKAKQRTSRRPA